MNAKASNHRAQTSAEIMAPSRRVGRGATPRKRLEIVDADFEIVPAGTVSHRAGDLPSPRSHPIASIAKTSVYALLLPAAFASVWVFAGHHADQADATKADLADVTSSIVRVGQQLLVKVDGSVVNRSRDVARIAPIVVTLTDRNALTTRYLVRVASAAGLAPGDQFAFSSRLSVPSDGAETVKVGFAD